MPILNRELIGYSLPQTELVKQDASKDRQDDVRVWVDWVEQTPLGFWNAKVTLHRSFDRSWIIVAEVAAYQEAASIKQDEPPDEALFVSFDFFDVSGFINKICIIIFGKRLSFGKIIHIAWLV